MSRWQGIIPFKAVPFALKACDNLIPSLISPQACGGQKRGDETRRDETRRDERRGEGREC